MNMKKLYIDKNSFPGATSISEFTRIDRIMHMERCFDALLEAKALNQESILTNAALKKRYETLKDYFENGLWLQDYESDERGEIPPDLKRGVLSQDALYDLLSEINDIDFEK